MTHTCHHITNALEAEAYTREMCREHFFNSPATKQERSAWCKSFFSSSFPRLLSCHLGKVLMGEVKEDQGAYRHRTYEF